MKPDLCDPTVQGKVIPLDYMTFYCSRKSMVWKLHLNCPIKEDPMSLEEATGDRGTVQRINKQPEESQTKTIRINIPKAFQEKG